MQSIYDLLLHGQMTQIANALNGAFIKQLLYNDFQPMVAVLSDIRCEYRYSAELAAQAHHIAYPGSKFEQLSRTIK